MLLALVAGLWAGVAARQGAVLAERAERGTQAGELDAALNDVRAALHWQPHDPALWRQQSVVLGQLASFRRSGAAARRAVTAARSALTNGPNDSRNALALGWALSDAGQLAEAVSAFQTAVRLDPHNQSDLYALGLAQERAGQRREAAQAYRAAWAVMPDTLIRDGLSRLGSTP